jgi:S-adenosyl-L-methionine hydrolase (adenosine-forming)
MHSSAARPRDLAPRVERVRTFADLPPGAAFWYENSNGLAEIAINQGRADRELGLSIGTLVEIVS